MIRVEKAAELLKNTGSKVIDVSFECGFNNVRSFNRTFKEITGYSPSQFMNLTDPDSYNFTYYKRKSSDREFVENDSLTVIKNKPWHTPCRVSLKRVDENGDSLLNI